MLPYQCANCRHFNQDEDSTCAAFPEGVPEEILTEEFDHTKPWPSRLDPKDRGIRFQPLKDD